MTDDELWAAAMDALREWGEDPEEVVRLAAANIERFTFTGPEALAKVRELMAEGGRDDTDGMAV